jgi:hypothetical protein
MTLEQHEDDNNTNNNKSSWIENMIKISVSSNYTDAISEWEPGLLSSFKGNGNCLCGARMKNFYPIQNKFNDNVVFAGSTCLKKIGINIKKEYDKTDTFQLYGEMPIFDILNIPEYLAKCKELIRKIKEEEQLRLLTIKEEQEQLRLLTIKEEEQLRLIKIKEEELRLLTIKTEEHQEQEPDTADLYRSIRLKNSKEKQMINSKEKQMIQQCNINKSNKLDKALCYIIRFGKYKNTNILTVYINDIQYFKWLNNNIDKGNIKKAINIVIKQEQLLNKRIKSSDNIIKLIYRG